MNSRSVRKFKPGDKPRRLIAAALAIAAVFGIPLACSHNVSSETAASSDEPAEAPAELACNDPDFVLIPAGEFIAGSDRAERDYGYRISAEAVAKADLGRQAQVEQNLRDRQWFESESPRQRVSLPAFCLGQNLVTNAEYQAFIKATGHRAPGITEAEYQRQGFLVHPYRDVVPFLWQGQEFPQGRGNHPVVLVSYDDAIAFARWKSQQDSVTYRLPSALEWEKAARGTDGRYFPWGNAWQDDATNWGQTQPQSTSVVGSFPIGRGPLGGEDLSGNVFEYTGSLAAGEARVVLKGCSWDDLPGFCRAAYQHTRSTQSRHILFGFRLALEPVNDNLGLQ